MKKLLTLAFAVLFAATLVGCGGGDDPAKSDPIEQEQDSGIETVVLTEKYVAWTQIDFIGEYNKLTDAQKETAKVVIEITDASGIQAGWGYGAAFIWHSWDEGDNSQSEVLTLTAPAGTSATGFTVEWSAADILKEYNPDSDAGFGINFWGAISAATLKVTLVYTK